MGKQAKIKAQRRRKNKAKRVIQAIDDHLRHFRITVPHHNDDLPGPPLGDFGYSHLMTCPHCLRICGETCEGWYK